MAIQVIGLFQNPQSKLIYQNPILKLVPHLQYPGKLSMDVLIDASGSIGAIGFNNVDKNTLTYISASTNPYDSLIQSLENYVIGQLQNSTSFNSSASFNIVSPPSQSM